MDENTPGSPNAPGQPSAPPVAPPPPPLPPPQMAFPVPPSPRPKNRGWMILALVLLALLAVSVLYNLGNFLAGSLAAGPSSYSMQAGPRTEEVILKDSSAPAKIAVIRVEGIISEGSYDGSAYGMVELVKAQLERAKEDSRVKAVLLKVDSPGGEVLAADEIYRAIEKFQSDTSKPVIASMGNLAASGGYYVSAPCRWIVANELTLTGSIGVIMSSLNYRGLMDKVGLQPFVYKSGKYKDMLSGLRDPQDIPPEERKMIQDLIDEVYGKFKEVVAAGRERAHKANRNEEDPGRTLVADWTEYADGRVFSGSEAFKLGFVDQLGDFDEAVERTLELAGVSRAKLIEYRPHYSLSDFFRMFGQAEGKTTIKVDIGVDAPRLRAGQLYFLSSSLAH